jgi:hypothetical protein
MDLNLNGKVALVTGSSKRIGSVGDSDQGGKRPLHEGYQPLRKGDILLARRRGYTPASAPASPAKPPQGGSGALPKPPPAHKK